MRDTKPEPSWLLVPAPVPACPGTLLPDEARDEPAPVDVVGSVVEVAPPGGSSEAADGVTGPLEPGSPAYGVRPAVDPVGGRTS